MNTILVTGGAGFIGSDLVRLILDEEPETRVLVYDLLTYAGNLDNLYEYMISRLTEANVSNEPELLEEVSGLLRNVKQGWDAIAQ